MTDEFKRVLRKHLDEADRIEEDLRNAVTAKERKDILQRKELNDHLLRALMDLAAGRLGEVPERCVWYEIRIGGLYL